MTMKRRYGRIGTGMMFAGLLGLGACANNPGLGLTGNNGFLTNPFLFGNNGFGSTLFFPPPVTTTSTGFTTLPVNGTNIPISSVNTIRGPVNTTVPGFTAGVNSANPVSTVTPFNSIANPMFTNPNVQPFGNVFSSNALTPTFTAVSPFGTSTGVGVGFNSASIPQSGIPVAGLNNSLNNPSFGPAVVPN